MLRATSCCVLMLVLSSAAHAQYLINSPGDAGRSPSATFAICDTGSTVVNPNTGQSVTECTLRALIETVNELPAGSSSTAGFVDWIPTQGILPFTRIFPQTPLPAINRRLHLDGTTHPNYDPDVLNAAPRVVLDGDQMPPQPPQTANGLLITSGGSGSQFEAISVRRFADIGIHIQANSVRVSRSRIGTDDVGISAFPNDIGIAINGNNNTIGQVAQAIGPPSITPTTPARNVISGNQTGGVWVIAGEGNRIVDNHIGTNYPGTAALPNGNGGVLVDTGAVDTIIGENSSSTPSILAGNLIAGHSLAGIEVSGSGTRIRCNYFGRHRLLNSALALDSVAISIIGALATDTVIGQANCPNTVLASDTAIRLGTDGAPIGADTVVQHNFIGTSSSLADPGSIMSRGIDARTGTDIQIRNNVIGHAEIGVLIGANTDEVELIGNEIGVAADGTALPLWTGIADVGSKGTQIGAQNAPNLIGNAQEYGIYLDSETSGNFLAHNFIGVTPDGHSAPVGNGVWVDGGIHQIGPNNVIGHTNQNGIILQSNGHQLSSNRIGTGDNGETWPIGLIGVLIGSDANYLNNNRIGNAQVGVQISVGRSGNTIQRNFIGANGALDFGNELVGVVVAGTDNLIGGTQPAHANQIGFNGGPGIRITGSDNLVQRNFIGVTADGIAMGNAGAGIEIHPNAGPNLIGGTPAVGNTLGNNQYGILVQADDTEIVGNRIGWTLDGSVHPQQQAGVRVDDGVGSTLIESNTLVQPQGPAVVLASNAGAANQIRFNRVGVDEDGAPLGGEPGSIGILAAGGSETLIIGNQIGYVANGIDIGEPSTGAAVVGNAVGVLPDGTAMPLNEDGIRNRGQSTVIGDDNTPNLIGNIGGRGLFIQPAATAAEVFGNWIGVTPAGHAAPVGSSGIQVSGDGHVLGTENSGNVIGYAGFAGIRVSISGSGGSGNQIIGNRVGTGFSGEIWPLVGATGLNVASSDNVIRGNVIGNAFNGVQVSPGSQGNLVQHNWIGVDENLNDIGNANLGVIMGGHNNILGGTLSAQGDPQANVIGFNQGDAVRLGTGSGNQVIGNWIGMAPDGTVIANQGDGVRVLVQAENAVIGMDMGRGNVIAGNDSGVRLLAAAEVAHNDIGGLPAVGLPGNAGHGVAIAAGVSGALIRDNHILQQGGEGVSLDPDAGTGNRITRNRIERNAGKGIDLGPGGRDQDPGDFDTGPNKLQNFPEFELRDSFFNPSTGQVEVRYRVDSDPTASDYPLMVEFFLADPAADSPQGMLYLGELSYSQGDAQEWVSAEFTPSQALTPGSILVATASTADGNTSEFSEAFGMPPAFSLGGEIQNLSGTIRLVNEVLDDTMELTGEGDLPFTMTQNLYDGESYLVTIAPDGMPDGQDCVVFNGEGTVDGQNVTDILVVCDAEVYQLGGEVRGLAGEVTLSNQVNGDQLSVSGSGSVEFLFPALLADGESWTVVVTGQPGGQICEVTENASGEIDGADRLDIVVQCAATEDDLFRDRFELLMPQM